MKRYIAISRTKIGRNRGKARIWIEGKNLAEAGGVRYERYDATFGKDSVTFTKNPEGKYKFSGRERNGKPIPIIDFNTSQVTEIAGDATHATIWFYPGKIVWKPEIQS